MSLTHHADDLSQSDLEKFFCAPYGLVFAELVGFPPASYQTRSGPRWICWDLTPWLTGWFRGRATSLPQYPVALQLEEQMRRAAPPQEHRTRAVDRVVSVGVARVLTRRLPDA